MNWHRGIAVLLVAPLALAGLGAIALGALLAVPVSPPPPLESIRAGALAVDRSGMPDLSHFQARDGSWLAYRVYPAANGDKQKIAILITWLRRPLDNHERHRQEARGGKFPRRRPRY